MHFLYVVRNLTIRFLWYYSSLLQKVLKLAGIEIRIKLPTVQELFLPPLVIVMVRQYQTLAELP